MTTQQPRIYTYKITFKGMPYWYWGVHKEKRYGECYFGSPKTRKWVWDFYEPEIQILELFPYTDEGWDEACEVEKRLIRPDLNKAECLNESCGGYFSLEVLRKVHAEKDEDGKSLQGKKLAAATNAEKDEDGKSVNAVKGGKKGWAATMKEKNEDGKSVNAVKRGKKGGAATMKEKNEDGKSVNAVKAGKKGAAAAKLVRQKKVELTRVSDKTTFVFDSRNDACRDLDLNRGTLSQVCNGERKTHKGYTARYLP